jgi:hypothetical protein
VGNEKLIRCQEAPDIAGMNCKRILQAQRRVSAPSVLTSSASRSGSASRWLSRAVARLVLAFALVTRKRFALAAAALGGAILLKQFAVVALPFIALMIPREEWKRAALAFAGVLAVGVLPFLVNYLVRIYAWTAILDALGNDFRRADSRRRLIETVVVYQPLLPSVPVIPRGTRNDGHQCCDRQRARQTI